MSLWFAPSCSRATGPRWRSAPSRASAQTYANKSLLIWDTGPDHEVRWLAREFRVAEESIHHVEDVPDFSIGSFEPGE